MNERMVGELEFWVVTKPSGAKYSEDQERDDSGRWTDQGGGGATQEVGSGKFKEVSETWASRNLKTEAELTGKQKLYIGDYTTEASDWVNGELRENLGKVDRNLGIDVPREVYSREDREWVMDSSTVTVGQVMSSMDKAIAGTEVPRDIVLYRGFDGAALTNLEVGQTFRDYGYGSTSVDRGTAKTFGDRLAIIEVPAGSSALFLGSLSNVASEDEVVLPRGSLYQVTEVSAMAVTVRLLP